MREESRKKETKKNGVRIQSEEYICYCVAVLPSHRQAQVRRRTHLPSQGFESEKCVYSFLFLKVSQVERVPGAAALHLNTGAH